MSEIRYKAWGEVRYASGATPTDYKYTGQLETDIGIYYFVARFFDPSIGRFLSADEVVPGTNNPLAWDRYLYSLANPLRYVDPTGHSACDVAGADPECNGLYIQRRPKPSVSKAVNVQSIQLPNLIGPPTPPVYVQTISGGITIGQNTGQLVETLIVIILEPLLIQETTFFT